MLPNVKVNKRCVLGLQPVKTSLSQMYWKENANDPNPLSYPNRPLPGSMTSSSGPTQCLNRAAVSGSRIPQSSVDPQTRRGSASLASVMRVLHGISLWKAYQRAQSSCDTFNNGSNLLPMKSALLEDKLPMEPPFRFLPTILRCQRPISEPSTRH